MIQMEGKDMPDRAQVEQVPPQHVEVAGHANFDLDEGEASKITLKLLVVTAVSSAGLCERSSF